MKHRKPISALLLGLALLVSGIAFKLNHLMGAVQLSNLGIALLVGGLIWLAASVFTTKKSD